MPQLNDETMNYLELVDLSVATDVEYLSNFKISYCSPYELVMAP